MSETDVQKMFFQLIDAVQYLREKKIMHRDIKPSNILLAKDGSLRLSDFGLAKQYQTSSSLSSTICGSPLYMAPELLYNEKYTTTCDVWSLGIVLYEMLFQRVPYQADSLCELKTKLDEETSLHIPDEISPLCSDLLQKLLTKKESKRIRWRELFSHPWLQYRKKSGSLCSIDEAYAEDGDRDRDGYGDRDGDAVADIIMKPQFVTPSIAIREKCPERKSVHNQIVLNFFSSNEDDYEFVTRERSYSDTI
tara:strand:- start:2518 stop:3267 length:750 start_codon:yes stop_codon:yes gene_type:complete